MRMQREKASQESVHSMSSFNEIYNPVKLFRGFRNKNDYPVGEKRDKRGHVKLVFGWLFLFFFLR